MSPSLLIVKGKRVFCFAKRWRSPGPGDPGGVHIWTGDNHARFASFLSRSTASCVKPELRTTRIEFPAVRPGVLSFAARGCRAEIMEVIGAQMHKERAFQPIAQGPNPRTSDLMEDLLIYEMSKKHQRRIVKYAEGVYGYYTRHGVFYPVYEFTLEELKG